MVAGAVTAGSIRRPTPERLPVGPLTSFGQTREVALAVPISVPAAADQPFVSRGDRSGTHATELRLWKHSGIDPKTLAAYRETGSGMGPTLNIAAATDAYTLSDRATWFALRNRRDHDLLLAGDPLLFNLNGVLPVYPALHPHVRKEAAERFAEWLTAPTGQQAIAAFRADGQPVFFPSARK